jgi:hypothetical protein
MNFRQKLLAAGSYFSLFVVPFLFPLIVYAFVLNYRLREHAKKAFLPYILPTAWIVGAVLFLLFVHTVSVSAVFMITGLALLNFVIMVWNAGNAIYVLVRE